MSVKAVLQEAYAVVQRDHTATQLAVDEHGQKVRPLDPAAVAWSSAGAICKVAPAMSVHDMAVWADSTRYGNDAFDLLEEAARLQGYANTVEADRAGQPAVRAMFEKAMQIVPERRGRRGGRA